MHTLTALALGAVFFLAVSGVLCAAACGPLLLARLWGPADAPAD